jgi:LacI family transcriptional regulator
MRSPSDGPIKRVALLLESQVSPRRRMLTGVARYMHEHDPWAIYLKPTGVEKSMVKWLREWKGDGIIAAVTETELEMVADLGIPVVDIVGFLKSDKVPLVHTNDRAVGRVGAEHLLERGFRHFAFVEYPFFWSADRRAAFVETVEAQGFWTEVYQLPFPSQLAAGPSPWEQQQVSLARWIDSLPKPVGVMTTTDLLGQQLLEACLRANVAVPEQVAVVGADNDEPICNIAFPPLSSVIINDHQRGYEAAAVLDRLMNGESPPPGPTYVEPIGVVSRASTDIMAIEDEALVTALRVVRDKACDGIGVDDVVRSVPLSRSVLERRFRKLVGRSINNEIVRVRLNRAVQLLSETQLELKVVAHRSGFGSTAYMTAVFQKKLGMTPGSYRSKARQRAATGIQTPISARSED